MLQEMSRERLEQKVRELELENTSLRQEVLSLESELSDLKGLLPAAYCENRLFCDENDQWLQLSIKSAGGCPLQGESRELVATDSPDNKKAFQRLKQSKDQIRDIISHLPGAVFQLIENSKKEINVFFVSQRVAHVFDMPLKKIVELAPLMAKIPKEDQRLFKTKMAEAVAAMSDSVADFRVRCEDGRVKWVRGAIKPEILDGGSILWSGFVIDVTDQKKIETSLEHSSKTIESIFKSAPVGIGVLKEQKIVSVNKALAMITGYAVEELTGACVRMLYQNDQDYNAVRLHKDHKFVIFGRHSIETRWKTKNNDVIDVVLSYTPIDISDLSKGMTFAVQDITLQKKDKEFLEVQARVLNTIHDLVRVTDLEGNTIYVNDAACRKMNRPRKEILTRKFDEYIRKHTYKITQEEIVKNTIKLGTWQGEMDLLLPDGKLATFQIRTHLIRDKEGNPWRIASVFNDITDHKKSKKDCDILLTAIEQSPDTVFITNAEGIIEYANSAFEHQTGYTKEECIGRDVRVLQSGEHNTQFFINLWGTISAGRIWKGEIINKRKDGLFYTVEAIISPMRDSKAEIINYVFMQRDISHQLEMGEKIAQAQKIESIGTLAGGIAHDFNNMLFPILGHAEILLQDEYSYDQSVKESLQQIYESALRAKDLIQQILTFSRRKKIVRTPMKIQFAIDDVLKLMQSSIPKHITLKKVIDENAPEVFADPTQMHQIIMNLLTNAVQAIPSESGQIEVTLLPVRIEPSSSRWRLSPGDYVCLKVSDTGTGMSKEVKRKIFEPFFTTKEEGIGTGMGLSVVYGIIKDMNGGIKIHSQSGKGSEFQIYLPVNVPIKPVELPPAIGSSDKDMFENRIHVLFVDDEPPILKIAGAILDRLGCDFTTMVNPEEAVRTVKENPFKFDLIITDMYMDQMNGDVLATEIKAIRPDIPIFLCTGFSEDISDSFMASTGIEAILTKPFNIKMFSDTINKILDERKKVKT